jgi:hypothetical protein
MSEQPEAAAAADQMKPLRQRHWRSDRYPDAFTVRCTPDEHRELAERAAAHELSLSRYCVWAGKREAPPPSAEETQRLRRLLYDLHKLGNNVNQLAHTLHASRKGNAPPPSTADIAAAAASLAELIADVRAQL